MSERIHSFVLGAGFAGMQAAAIEAMAGEGKTVVCERGTDLTATKYRNDLQTPSQDEMRGSRVIDQPNTLKRVIDRSWGEMENLSNRTGLDIMADRFEPYVMVVKGKDHYTMIEHDLTRAGLGYRLDEDFAYKTIRQAEKDYGISLPKDYAGVIDAGGGCATKINAGNLMEACRRMVEQNHGEFCMGSELTGYAKLKDGTHWIEITDAAGKKQEYIADNMIVAPGPSVGDVLTTMQHSHEEQLKKCVKDVADDGAKIPERFTEAHNFEVPQRTLYVKLPENVSKKLINKKTGKPKFGALYMLDIDHAIDHDGATELLKDHLGFYTFTKQTDDGLVMKIGYDPMSHISKKGGADSFKEKEFEQQEKHMLDFLSTLFKTPITSTDVIKRGDCAYPMSTIHHPCAGKSKQFHDVVILADQQGYGCMAGLGQYAMLKENDFASLGREWDPDSSIREVDIARREQMFGVRKPFPQPPILHSHHREASR